MKLYILWVDRRPWRVVTDVPDYQWDLLIGLECYVFHVCDLQEVSCRKLYRRA